MDSLWSQHTDRNHGVGLLDLLIATYVEDLGRDCAVDKLTDKRMALEHFKGQATHVVDSVLVAEDKVLAVALADMQFCQALKVAVDVELWEEEGLSLQFLLFLWILF